MALGDAVRVRVLRSLTFLVKVKSKVSECSLTYSATSIPHLTYGLFFSNLGVSKVA